MEARTDTSKTAAGRRDSQGVPAVPKQVAEKIIDELVHLHRKKAEATDAYNEAIKKTAEKHGMLSAVIAKKVAAKANDKLEDEKNKVAQMAFIFGIVDEIDTPEPTES